MGKTLIFRLKEKTKIFKRFNSKLTFFLLLLLLFFPILPYNISSILLICFSFLSIAFNWRYGLRNLKQGKYKYLLINNLFIVLITFTLLYTANLNAGFKKINTLLPFIISPLIIVYLQRKYSENEYFLFYLFFILSNFLFLIFTLYYFLHYSVEHCFYDISELSLFEKIPYVWDNEFKTFLWCAEQKKEPFFMLHKTYNSINLLIASLFIIQLYFKRNNSIITKLILLLLLAVFLISIIYFKSLTVIFLVVTILPINILFLKYNKKLAAFLSGVIVLIIISAVIVKKDVVINNFKKETIQNQDGLEESDLNGISERFFLNKTSTKVISKSPIFGYGIGDVQDQLNDQNFANSKTTKQYLKFYLNKLNSHNYYYNLILIGGPLLLISFIFMMYYNMGMAIKNKEYSYLSFLIIIVICLFFENLFDRMTGVLSFTLINSLLAKNIFDRK